MTMTKEWLVDLQEKYEKVKKLIDEDSKLDPENEPYMSKYAARQLLVGMKVSVETLLLAPDKENKDTLKLKGMLGTIFLYLGTIAVDTAEMSTAEKYLNQCQQTIETYELRPQIILVSLNMLNQLGLLWSVNKPEKSKHFLENAENLYKTFKSENDLPLDISDLFKANLDNYDSSLGNKNLEKVHTLTLYYLAQIYGALKDDLRSSVYCHITLKRQLANDDYDFIDWALNCATLSQFFMEKNGFKQARHHLAASSYMLKIYETQLNQITERDESYDAKIEIFKHRSADVARCWAKYGLLLLSSSKDRLLKEENDDKASDISSDLAKLKLTSDDNVTVEDLLNLEFRTLNVSAYENQITCDFVLTFQDARKVFFNIQEWLKNALEYYTLESLASDYIKIIQDQSQMYYWLIFFEDNPDNQAKMHKRRADLLEKVITEVNPTYYMEYCRQIWCELGEIYSEIMEIKMEKIREMKERPSPHALSKNNSLIEKSIQNYSSFIDSFKEISTNSLPKTIKSDWQKTFLQCHLHIAALHSKYISLDKRVTIKRIESSLLAYNKVIEYCKENSETQELIPSELSICKDMATMLPLKIAKLSQELS